MFLEKSCYFSIPKEVCDIIGFACNNSVLFLLTKNFDFPTPKRQTIVHYKSDETQVSY